MENIVKIYKKRGETPLEALELFRVEHPVLNNTPMTYAGRLDPLAEGELVILIGEECKNKEKYTDLDKEYEVEILFGFETDTGDILGIVTKSVFDQHQVLVKNELESFVGKHSWKYPAYSSKTVNGKPLFQYALDGEIDSIEIPKKEIEIYSIKMLEKRTITCEDLLREIIENIGLVKGDFRQTEIINKWRSVLKGEASEFFAVQKILVHCSSGTYMRTLAEKIGKVIGVPALAYHIVRTKIFEN